MSKLSESIKTAWISSKIWASSKIVLKHGDSEPAPPGLEPRLLGLEYELAPEIVDPVGLWADGNMEFPGEEACCKNTSKLGTIEGDCCWLTENLPNSGSGSFSINVDSLFKFIGLSCINCRGVGLLKLVWFKGGDDAVGLLVGVFLATGGGGV